LDCSQNQITNLNLSGDTALFQLDCGRNQLTNLDVSANIALNFLNCYNNWNLTNLDLSNNTSLTSLSCSGNGHNSLDLSNNTALTYFNCSDNPQLSFLDVRNGNSTNIIDFNTTYNFNLTCINVDDVAWSTVNWTLANGNIDASHYFSNNCSGTSIQEHSTNKELLKTTDLLGRETKGTKNEVLFYIFNDGTVEKRIIVE